MNGTTTTPISKIATGIPGFDDITNGGLPKGRTTLISGSAGSAKTVFAVQFLTEGILQADEAGVFVTFEESPSDIRQNMASFGWYIEDWEQEEKWAFVDASPQLGEEKVVTGSFDLGALVARIEHAVLKTNAKRVAIDSVGAIFTQFPAHGTIRTELFRIATALKKMGVTAVLICSCV